MMGVCLKIYDCPSRLREVMERKRTYDSAGRCGFDNFTEIVCCKLNVTEKIGLRPAEIGTRRVALMRARNASSDYPGEQRDRAESTINFIRDIYIFRSFVEKRRESRRGSKNLLSVQFTAVTKNIFMLLIKNVREINHFFRARSTRSLALSVSRDLVRD